MKKTMMEVKKKQKQRKTTEKKKMAEKKSITISSRWEGKGRTIPRNGREANRFPETQKVVASLLAVSK